MIIQVKNDLHLDAPKTRLAFTESSGASTLRWENPNGFQASWAIQVGEMGQEQTEVVLLNTSTPAGTAGTITATTLYEHPADTPIYGIKFDKVVFEVSATGTAGTANPITGGTVKYQPDSKVTQFDYTTGASTDAYKSYFRNSVLESTTTESDWVTTAGLEFYTLGKLRQRVKDKLWDTGFIKNDDIIDDWINEWKEEMINEVIAVNQDYALGTEDVVFGTDGLGTISQADYTNLRRVWVTYGDGNYRSIKTNINDWFPNQTFSSTHPQHAFIGNSVIQIQPADQGGTMSLHFYQFGTTLVNDTDLLPIPMRSFTKSFVDYGVAQALFKDEKDKSNEKTNEANAAKSQFKAKLTPRDKSGPTYISIVESVSGEGSGL